MKKLISLLLALAMVLSILPVTLAAPAEKTADFAFLATSDLHGQIFATDYTADQSQSGTYKRGLTRVSTYVNEMREAYGEDLFLADLGDTVQGTPLSYYFAFEKPELDDPTIKALRTMKYDMWVPGNHEYNYGLGILQRQLDYAVSESTETEGQINVCLANYLKAETNNDEEKDWATWNDYAPYVIKEMGGVKVAIIGFGNPNVPKWDIPANWEGIYFANVIDTYLHYEAEMLEKADMIVVMSHSGINSDPGSDFIERLVQATDTIDFAFTGHEHGNKVNEIANKNGDTVYVLQPYTKARVIAQVLVTVEEDGSYTLEPSLLNMENYALDEDLVSVLQPYEDAVWADYMSIKLGEASDDFSAANLGTAPSAFMDLVNQVQIWGAYDNTGENTPDDPTDDTPAMISFSAPLTSGDNPNIIPKGDVCLGDMFKLYRYENWFYQITMSGEEVHQWLEFAATKIRVDADGNPYVSSGDLTYYDVAYGDGFSYKIDYTQPKGMRIVSMTYNGEEVKADDTFTVVVNNYRYNGGGNYVAWLNAHGCEFVANDENRVIYSTQFDMIQGEDKGQARTLLSDYIAMKGVIDPTVTSTWEVGKFTENDITILYTNDAHTYIDGAFSYDNIAALKAEYEAAGKAVLLVDAGDHIQGTAYGSMDKGETIVKLMNAAGYDVATLGNHEFDYGMDGAKNVVNWADYTYLSANFYHEKDGVKGETVLDAYVIYEFNGLKIAIVGVTTPESFTKSTPAYFQDEEGNYIYGIAGGEDGAALYGEVQAAIDAALAEGADYVIGLGHLGDDPASQPWTSEELIANTTGLDAFIDGHSHSKNEYTEVADKEGNIVVLTQTGEYLKAVGKMTISAEGITTELVSDYAYSDADVAAIKDAWIAEIQTQLGEVIAYAEVTFDNYIDGGRIVRKQETNTGDFAADALYYLFDNMGLDVDVAIMNGGGVRNKAITGEMSYLTCKAIHTFGNVACLQTITGQQLLDALEWGARDAGAAECGGFLHVSGITYEIHTYIASTVQKDEKGVWTGAPTGEYRVKNVKILQDGEYVDLELDAKYNLAGYNYTLRDLGDGFAMFDGAVNVLDYVMEDYLVLANYLKSFPVDEETGLPTVGADSIYAEVTGAGRITQVGEDPDALTYENVLVESTIREGAEIPTYITLPADYDSEIEYPVVFMIHGHGGNHNEWGGYDTISDGLAENGIIAVTLDFPGCGASTESFILNTMTNMKQDVLDVIAYVTENYSIDEDRIGGFGYSMGGRIILELTAEELYAFDTIEFVAPAEDLEDLKNLFGGAENWEVLKAEANENGYVEFTTIYSTLPLSKEWFADLEKYPDGLKELAAEKYTGNSMVFWATDDAAVSPWVSEGVAETFNSAILNVYSLGHSYGFYGDDPYVDRVTTEGSVGYFVHEFTCEEEGVHGYVKTVDEHGCLVLTVTAEDLAAAGIELGDSVTVKFGDVWGTVTYAETLGEVGSFLVEEDGQLVVKDAKIENLAEYLGLGEFVEGNWYYADDVEIPVSVAIVEEPAFVNPFTDVPEDVWYTEYVLMMAEAGIIKGMTETTFEPETNLTRAQMVTMLYRLLDEPKLDDDEMTNPFTDVADGLWYTDAVSFAYAVGLVNGVTDTTFEPDTEITREQFVTILYRLAKLLGADVSVGENTNILSYPDATKVSPYAMEAIQWACGAGILNGTSFEGDPKTYLDPQGLATRAQAAKLLVTFLYAVGV